jgi:methyl-accepting chemotaxis protein
MEPYFYKIAGKDVFMTTIAIPVKDQGKVIGAVTVDLPVASFQDSVSKIRPYETGYATLSSHLGVIIGTADGTLVGKKLSEQSGNQALSEAILQGKDYDDDVYDSQLGTTLSRIYVPVKVGNTTTPWSLVSVYRKTKFWQASASYVVFHC